jgi:hypothetical protein
MLSQQSAAKREEKESFLVSLLLSPSGRSIWGACSTVASFCRLTSFLIIYSSLEQRKKKGEK